MGEKPQNTYKRKTRENSPFGCPPIQPSIKLKADCFPRQKNRKQAGPTLGGRGILIYRGKRKKGRARYGLIAAGDMIFFIHMNVQDL